MARMWTCYGKLWPIFGLDAGATYCPVCANVGSMANILPIYCLYCCKYMGHEITFGRAQSSIVSSKKLIKFETLQFALNLGKKVTKIV